MDTRTLGTAATILFNNLVNTLNNSKSSQDDLEQALKPFAIIQWNKELIQRIGVDKINRVFGRLKRSTIPKLTLRSIIDHFHEALADKGAIIPTQFMDWRDIISKYSLGSLATYSTWVPVIQFLVDNRSATPRELSRLTLTEINQLARDSPLADLITSIWQSARIEFNSPAGVNSTTLTFRNNSLTLVEALRAASLPDSVFAEELKESKEDIGLPNSFEKLGPAAKINALKQATPDSQQLLRFLSAGAQSNILEQVRATLPSVASGVSCYLSFCALLGIAPFPPSADVVARWSAIFAPGKTYSLYLSHLSKACQLMEIDSSWRTDTVRGIAKGLANKPSLKARFHNSLTPAILDRLMKKESWDSEFARLCFVSFLFMLRLPSEALPLTRALPNELLLSDEAPSAKAVIGLREFMGENRLILKLAKRKNQRSLYTAMRPCFCTPNCLVPAQNCPIHQFWEAVIKHTHPGSPLFPSLQKKNITRIIRRVLSLLDVIDAERYSTHCFRRGAATALLDSGSTLSEIMKTGGWASGSFRIYLNLQKAEESSLKDILGQNSPDSSPVGSPSLVSSTSSGTTTPQVKRQRAKSVDTLPSS